MLRKALLTVVTSLVLVVGVLVPTAEAKTCTSNILTFPAWHKNLKKDSECRVSLENPTTGKQDINMIWVIALNAIEILLQVVAYVALSFIIWGGFKYMKSRGEPAAIQQAKMAILNAAIGLGIGLSSVAIVQQISKGIAGGSAEKNNLPMVNANAAQLSSVMNNIVLPIAGAVAVIFIIIGGFQYATSNGEPAKTNQARGTLVYAIVGLVFVIFAFAIVQLILGRFQI